MSDARRRVLGSLAGFAAAMALFAACGPITPFIRERCDADARRVGSPAEDEEIKLVQRLLLALSTNDFIGFQTLQPTQSQYVAYAWRNGAKRADQLVDVIQKPAEAREAFGALVTRLRAAGIEARSADRCTRRLSWDPKSSDRYDLIVSFGKERLTVPIYASSERVSVAGRPDLEFSAARVFLHRTMALAFDLVERLERATTREAALAEVEAFSTANAAELPKLESEAVPLAELVSTPGVADAPQHALLELAERWHAAMEHHVDLESDARFQAAMAPFRVLGGRLEAKVNANPKGSGPVGPTCQRYFERLDVCAAAASPEVGKSLKDGVRQQREAWSTLPSDALEAGCQAVLDVSKENFAAICPNVHWE